MIVKQLMVKSKEAIKEYQCSGCMFGPFEECYSSVYNGITCKKHKSGTVISNIGKIFLGLPKGFNRIGPIKEDVKNNIKLLYLFEKFEDGWGYCKFNIPVWKFLNENGHTLVRGISPRINYPFIHIFLKDCMNKIDCLEITQSDLNKMD